MCGILAADQIGHVADLSALVLLRSLLTGGAGLSYLFAILREFVIIAHIFKRVRNKICQTDDRLVSCRNTRMLLRACRPGFLPRLRRQCGKYARLLRNPGEEAAKP